MKSLRSPLRRRRGATLAVVMILIPMAVALYLVVMTRLEGSLRETQREQYRTQAKLLAESTLATLEGGAQAELLAQLKEKPLERTLKGAGSYRLALLPAQGNPPRQRLKATGVAKGLTARFICEIEAEVAPPAPGTPRLRLLGLAYRVEPLSKEKQAEVISR